MCWRCLTAGCPAPRSMRSHEHAEWRLAWRVGFADVLSPRSTLWFSAQVGPFRKGFRSRPHVRRELGAENARADIHTQTHACTHIHQHTGASEAAHPLAVVTVAAHQFAMMRLAVDPLANEERLIRWLLRGYSGSTACSQCVNSFLCIQFCVSQRFCIKPCGDLVKMMASGALLPRCGLCQILTPLQCFASAIC